LLWIMLNPSRADALVDDPTIRRCIGFARAWGYAEMEVVNLYAFRASEPEALRRHADPVGPDNDRHIAEALARAAQTIVAWGAFEWARERADHVLSLIPSARCLGLTRAGFPRHPLYVKSDARPITLASAIRRTTGACRAPAKLR